MGYHTQPIKKSQVGNELMIITNKDVNVLFIWDVPARLREYLVDGLKSVENVNLVFPDSADDAEFLRRAADFDVIIGWRPSRELLFAGTISI